MDKIELKKFVAFCIILALLFLGALSCILLCKNLSSKGRDLETEYLPEKPFTEDLVENSVVPLAHIECPPDLKGESAYSKPQYIDLIDLGKYKLTAYCACVKCCGKEDGITATGTVATQGRTIAVDPQKIPYGTEVLIDGHVYVAEDCGGAIKGNRIDVYFDSHTEALEFGVRYMELYKVSEGD